MTAAYQTNALWVCKHVHKASGTAHSDGDGGPDDGTNHVHPEDPFHRDLYGNILPHKLHK